MPKKKTLGLARKMIKNEFLDSNTNHLETQGLQDELFRVK